MKKLALALVCLFSVAFFASCDPEEPIIENPEPTIALMTGDDFVYNGQVIELDTEYLFGVRVESNAQTQQALSKLVVTYSSELFAEDYVQTIDLTGLTEYDFIDTLYYVISKGEIIGDITYSAVVTDAAGKTNSVSVKVDVNMEDELEATPFEWRRDNGADGTGLAEFGLKWTYNVNGKSHAVIEPLENAILAVFTPEDWENVTTETQKAALFTEAFGVAEYKEISTTASSDYDLVIGTIYNEEAHLIHITHCSVYERGWHFVVTGEAK